LLPVSKGVINLILQWPKQGEHDKMGFETIQIWKSEIGTLRSVSETKHGASPWNITEDEVNK